WNISAAADRLRIARNTFRYRMARYGLRSERAYPRRRRSSGPEASADSELERDWADDQVEARPLAWLQVEWAPTDESAPTLFTRTVDLFIEKVESFGGRLEQVGPGGIIGTFGVEVAEDASRRAAHAGLAILRASASSGETMGKNTVRLAVHAALG